ncbi:hypothetical protein [Clostridium butyricum]|uniref:hypothetical protein n=1 Tax=Clostridium butyricum TaxID=1492 RepID=UPI0012B903B6|nr:hypothetical protein [Clostridium butyricum]
MDKLVVISPILFEAHLYKIGEELPASNHEMVKLWLDNGMARWENNNEEKTESNIQAIGNLNENVDEKKEIEDYYTNNINESESENIVDIISIENDNKQIESNQKSNEKTIIGRRNK